MSPKDAANDEDGTKVNDTTTTSPTFVNNVTNNDTNNDKNKSSETVGDSTRIICPVKGQPCYVICHSSGPFQMPSNDNSDRVSFRRPGNNNPTKTTTMPEEVNQQLHLNLGLPIDPMNPKLRNFCKAISDHLMLPVEEYIFSGWEAIPLRFRQKMMVVSWSIYFFLHRWSLGRRTGIHPEASLEYHALTTCMYWSRFFPVTIRRMRFSLRQLGVSNAPEAYPPLLPRRSNNEIIVHGASIPTTIRNDGTVANVFTVDYDMTGRTHLSNRDSMTDANERTVTGYYVQHGKEPSEKVIFWLYGGAFLSGDSKGNINIAEKMGQRCDYTDVFLADYRLLPEYEFSDSLHDVVQAYEYLITIRGVRPENVILLGISSGAGLAVRLMQSIVDRRTNENETNHTTYSVNNSNNGGVEKSKIGYELQHLLRNPSGAVLMGPCVDYTEPKGSMKEYTKHDLIVNQSVYEAGKMYIEAKMGGNEHRRLESPVYRSLRGLPPLCIVVSEHECCYDQSVLLVNSARAEGVDVILGVWKYMCHVFPLLSMFLPEGRQAMDFMCTWMKESH